MVLIVLGHTFVPKIFCLPKLDAVERYVSEIRLRDAVERYV